MNEKKFSYIKRHLLLCFFLLLTLYPFVWMFFSAFRTEADLRMRPLAMPNPWTAANLLEAIRSGSFLSAYGNSFLLCTITVSLTCVIAALAAFAFARFKFPAVQALFMFFLLGLMIPVHITLIPLNQLMGANFFNLKSSLFVLSGPYAGFALPVSILILRRAFEAIPKDLIDSGILDGCSNWQVFWHIALPLSKPALATVVIFNFLTMWNEYAFALTLLRPGLQTVPLAIAEFKGEFDLRISTVCAALLLVMIPLFTVYIFAQKHIIRGLTAGSIKE